VSTTSKKERSKRNPFLGGRCASTESESQARGEKVIMKQPATFFLSCISSIAYMPKPPTIGCAINNKNLLTTRSGRRHKHQPIYLA
jgi:hypothetical protein